MFKLFKNLFNAFKDKEEEFDPYKKFKCDVYVKATGEYIGETTLDFEEYKEKAAFDTKYVYRRKRDDEDE